MELAFGVQRTTRATSSLLSSMQLRKPGWRGLTRLTCPPGWRLTSSRASPSRRSRLAKQMKQPSSPSRHWRWPLHTPYYQRRARTFASVLSKPSPPGLGPHRAVEGGSAHRSPLPTHSQWTVATSGRGGPQRGAGPGPRTGNTPKSIRKSSRA